ncbi:hypothetical protein JOF53_006660 [Crossiella equi]|uniref:DUF6801 domain-containing protein n=1 Tax=Crossiella equi TaxID=130796 RepID=A0ABS5AMJ0_9PSEU|nr:DUF6801 domain-containing protein [Crossiella equi]MBP2477788.1 hypothetical protein [Crossiella equi]
MTRTGPVATRLGALTSAAVLVLALGVALVGDGSAAAAPPSRVAYTCTTPDLAAQAVATEVAGAFPASGQVGTPVQSSLTVTVKLPETAIPALRGARSVVGVAALGLTTSGAGTSGAVTAEDLTVPATEVPATGELTVVATGKAPALKPTRPGDLTIGIDGLKIGFAVPTDDPGTTTSVELTCVKDTGQDSPLAVVPVTGTTSGTRPTSGPPTSATGTPVPGTSTSTAPEDGGLGALARRIRYKVEGVTRVKKQESEMNLGPGEMLTEVIIALPKGTIKGDLTLPPSNSYFTMFRFTPANSVIEFEPTGQVTGEIERGQVKAVNKMVIRVRGAKVAGVPLDVGPNCRTEEMTINLVSATPPPAFLPTRPTPMSATYTIPPFHGCGVTEPLDSLLTGLISGPDNTLKLNLTFLGYE